MFKRITYRTFFFAAITMATFGCKSTPSGPSSPTIIGPPEFGFVFNGVLFDRKNFPASTVFSDAWLYRGNPKNLSVRLDIFDTAHSVVRNVSISFDIGTKLPDTVSFSIRGGASTDSAIYSSDGKGFAILTAFDSVNNVVSGTFSFEVALELGTGPATIQITSGSFTNIPISYGSYGQGIVTAIADGKPFTSGHDKYANIDAYTSFGDPHIRITSIDGDSLGETQVDFTLLNPKLQEYDLSLGNSDVTAAYTFKSNTYYHGAKATVGKFTINNIDSVNHRLSATFDFSGYDSVAKKIVQVTNGVIDNVKWLDQ